MLKNLLRNKILLLFLILLTTSIFAQGTLDNLSIHGFVSRGYLKTTNNNYLLADSKDGSLEYGEATLSFMAMPSSKLGIGAQLYARDFGSDDNFFVIIDWAYGDYRWYDYLGFRVGRFKNATSLYSKIRDIDITRVPILLPQSVYDESGRDLALAIDGVGLYGRIPVSGLGDFEYEASYGGYNIFNQRSKLFTEQYYTISSDLAASMAGIPGILSANSIGESNAKAKVEDVMVVNLTWHTPLQGFKTGFSYNTSKFKWAFESNIQMLFPSPDPTNPTHIEVVQTIPVLGDFDIGTKTFFGEWQFNKFTLAGEYRKYVIEGITTMDITESDIRIPRESYYGMGAYQFNSWFALSGYYSVFYSNSDDKDGDLLVAAGKPDYYAWQKDLCFTARFDLTQNWIFKMEYHAINGAGQLSQDFNADGFEKDMGLFILKSTFHF